jgi:lysophospholipase L1-like esterase
MSITSVLLEMRCGQQVDTVILGMGADEAKEQKRVAVNAFIRSGAFDGVLDFDALTRDPANPKHILAKFDSGDHLHPNDAGYRAMAESIDLKALLGN